MREKTLPLLLFRVLVVVFLSYALLLNPASGFGDEGKWQPGGEEGGGETGEGGGEVVQGEDWFLMKESVPVIQTYAGTMMVLKGIGIRPIWQSPIHIGFITMEPQSLFIPQYLDSNIIFYVKKGIYSYLFHHPFQFFRLILIQSLLKALTLYIYIYKINMDGCRGSKNWTYIQRRISRKGIEDWRYI